MRKRRISSFPRFMSGAAKRRTGNQIMDCAAALLAPSLRELSVSKNFVSFRGGRSPTWESHVKCFEFAKACRSFKTILRDCHGCKHPRNDSLGTFLTVWAPSLRELSAKLTEGAFAPQRAYRYGLQRNRRCQQWRAGGSPPYAFLRRFAEKGKCQQRADAPARGMPHP